MKKGLLATTALICAGVLSGGAAVAAEAPTWKLGGGMNFQLYWIDADYTQAETTGDGKVSNLVTSDGDIIQDHGWYFGVDEAELALKVDGAADNGLKYGFKIEIQVNTDDGTVADEARIQLSGNWGTVQLGDEDGAEDSMNYGGENLMGATGGFDGDAGDILLLDPAAEAPTGPSIAGDTSDATKVTYYSPRFSGFQVGASLTPTPNSGDGFKEDGKWEDHIGLGANYDNTFGSVRVRASAVYSAASSTSTGTEDVGAWSVGGIVGFGAFSLGANYTNNGDSGQGAGTGNETWHWNAAGSFSTGPFTLAAGYFVGVYEFGNGNADDEFTNLALTADYTMAPGLGVYADLMLITDEDASNSANDQEATIFILGAKVSF